MVNLGRLLINDEWIRNTMIILVVFTATNIHHGLGEVKRISSPFDFEKNLLFNGKSMGKEKDQFKENNRAEGKGTKSVSGENGTIQGWTFQIEYRL